MVPLSVAWDDIGGLVDAHERFLAGARVESDVRDSVLDSWKRCRFAGLEPHRLLIPYAPDLAVEDPLLRAAEPVLKRLTASFEKVSMAVVLCDGQARLVQRHGGDRQLLALLDEVNFAPGFCASEEVAGTNGVGTALAERRPVYVVGREHFADCLSLFTCAGAPVRNPLSGRIEAVLDLTCLRDEGDPAMVRLVHDAARDIETRLLEQATERERALLTAYRRASHAADGGDAWPRQPEQAPTGAEALHEGAGLGRLDLAVLREKAEELIASPHLTFDEVALSGGRVAILLRRPIRGDAGEIGVVVEARVLGEPRLRHVELATDGSAAPGAPPLSAALPTVTAAPVPTPGASTASATPGVAPAPGAGSSAGPTASGAASSAAPTLPAASASSAESTPPAASAPSAVSSPPASDAPAVSPFLAASATASVPSASAVVMRTVVSAPADPAAPAVSPSEAPAAPAVLPPEASAAPAVPPPEAPAAPAVSAFTALREDAGDSAADGWLLLVGEPGVGRLAVLARRRLELLHDAGVRIGTTLDVAHTAEELAEVTVPRFADFTAVDLPASVLRGDEPGPLGEDTALRRVALGAVSGESPLQETGGAVHYGPATPQAHGLESGQSVLEPDLAAAEGRHGQDSEGTERMLAAGFHSLITVPLQARGATLGVVSFYRSRQPAPFEDDDLSLAQELAGRAAICIDNARRYTREHTTALALQRSLLPRGRPEQSAVEAAFRYLPAQAGVGGDWFDVIPLSGARVALVVGDVVGHGLHAAATMGRLRTAVHNFCSLDLPPDDLLTHLDDLVGRLDRGEGWAVENTHPDAGIVGATCLYAVYDPVTRRCSLTRAGHPVPAVVGPDGTVEFVDLPSGPPLGLGGMPFETVELDLAEGSQLVLYTDGLIEDRLRDIDTGLERLRTVLACAGRPPEETCDAVLDALLADRPSDDVALLVARTNALGPERVAQWELPSDPAVVSRTRAAVTGQMAVWGLDDMAFTTELVASELVTNAIRHATGPVRLRLLRDRALICEVSDGSSTSPRLRRARTEDEGGRGLFLVAQLTERWGTRYTTDGKVIWTEQPLP
ncbi:SpoIIE family protein phosphatase [Streptomyces sp. NPDC059866]|uniref:SpoIIE family protein phosphatase n=1 Tax=Streptomyces sp. NPDC059866 TaxID=3346978 RepID=UPI00364748DF